MTLIAYAFVVFAVILGLVAVNDRRERAVKDFDSHVDDALDVTR